eukprot:3150894-Amphidinium_carterae.1
MESKSLPVSHQLALRCCTIRGDLEAGLMEIVKAHRVKPLDAIMIETTGMADPVPIVRNADAMCRDMLNGVGWLGRSWQLGIHNAMSCWHVCHDDQLHRTFMSSEDLTAELRLDGVVTVADAKNLFPTQTLFLLKALSRKGIRQPFLVKGV